MDKKLTVALLGAGGRGSLFGEKMQSIPEHYEISAVCDINPKQLDKIKKLLNLDESKLFSDEETFFEKKRADVIVIATYDKCHVRQCIRAMKQGYDILLEKPICYSRKEITELLDTRRETGRKVTVCHELRYAPAFEKVSELLRDGVIGRLIAIDAMERVVWWHQAQAYVRIQSQINDVTAPTILAKCSHDLDLVCHYANSECDTVSSIGSLGFFRKENAPKNSTEKCFDCPHVNTCPYSAKRIYIDMWKSNGCPEFTWPYNKVSLKKPTTEKDLYDGIRNTYFGNCVFKCGVNTNEHVTDHQLVQMKFKNGVTANLNMVFGGEAGRRINLFGTLGEIVLDEREEKIIIYRYGEEKSALDFKSITEGGNAHGGGDSRLVKELYYILTGESENRTSLEDSVESHLIGISAEESRLDGGKLVKVHHN